jgi:hypothetical protein
MLLCLKVLLAPLVKLNADSVQFKGLTAVHFSLPYAFAPCGGGSAKCIRRERALSESLRKVQAARARLVVNLLGKYLCLSQNIAEQGHGQSAAIF